MIDSGADYSLSCKDLDHCTGLYCKDLKSKSQIFKGKYCQIVAKHADRSSLLITWKIKAKEIQKEELLAQEAADALQKYLIVRITDYLPENKPRYWMGIGYAHDIVVCSAMGVDMYDCVFPTRTARLGRALTRNGPMHFKSLDFRFDSESIDSFCECPTCK